MTTSESRCLTEQWYLKAREVAKKDDKRREAFFMKKAKGGKHPDTHLNFWRGFKAKKLPAFPRFKGKGRAVEKAEENCKKKYEKKRKRISKDDAKDLFKFFSILAVRVNVVGDRFMLVSSELIDNREVGDL